MKKKIASSENGLDLWGLSWPPAPHPLWSAFTPTTPRPWGVIREPPNGPVGCQPILHCLFSNQITIFNRGHEPRAKSKQTSVWNCSSQLFHRSSPSAAPVRTPRPTLVFCFVVVCFQQMLPLWIANGQNWEGEVGGLFRVGKRGGEGLAPGTAVTEIRSQRRIGKAARAFCFSLWTQGTAFTVRGPALLPAHMTTPSGRSVSGFHTLVAAWIYLVEENVFSF